MSDEPQVLAVFDVRDPASDRWRAWEPLMDWIREHDADPGDVFRAEVLLLDAPFVRFGEYVRDDDGQIVPVRTDGRIQPMRASRDVPFRRMPPEPAA